MIVLIIPILVGIYFFENILGYYRFKNLCSNEKTLQVIHKVDPDVGWILDSERELSKYDAYFVASLPHVKFVRFKNFRDQQTYDVRYLGGNPNHDESFEMRPSNFQDEVTYQWKQISESFTHEPRTSRFGNQVIDLRTKRLVVNLTNIGYSTFDRSRTLFDAPSGNTCDWYEYLGKESNRTVIFGT